MDRELFYEIILFAEERGYKGHLGMLPVMPLCETTATLLAIKIFWQRRYEIIFNHDFAKALWGEETIDHMISDDDIIMGDFGEEWQYHLGHMVIKKDPFEYLKKEYTRIKS